MDLITSLESIRPDQPTVLTIGTFDGVHVGHRRLITEMVAAAHARDMRAGVLTFYPHPAVVLRGREPAFYITSPAEKAALFAEFGIDLVVTHPFDHETSLITAGEFLQRLQAHLDVREIWAGPDFAMGHNREGTLDWFRERSPQTGVTVHVCEPVTRGGEVVSSSRVRAALRAGDIEQVTSCLGRPFRIPGVVVEGKKRGQTIGVATANLDLWAERAYPAVGVYACTAFVGSDRYAAATNIGFRPTFDDENDHVSIEAHLLDFEGDLYGQEIALDFHTRLRPEKKFESVDALIAQVHADIATAREIHAQYTEGALRP